MSEIYLAHQMTVDREVALKILSPALADTHPQLAEQFISEARAAGRFKPPNIIAVHDVGQFTPNEGEAAGRIIHYFSMEYINGDNFHDIIKRNGKVATEHFKASYGICHQRRGLCRQKSVWCTVTLNLIIL